ncbi:hypothetical protein HED60_05825 [Planctomycetales bacterium ZRK34]|nr:hypothetical protein HED60_05825 [Planctomycetales bacterium ZRK34]
MAALMTRRMLLEITWRRRGDHRSCYCRMCIMCGTVFYAGRPEARYCQSACRQRAYRQRVRAARCYVGTSRPNPT